MLIFDLEAFLNQSLCLFWSKGSHWAGVDRRLKSLTQPVCVFSLDSFALGRCLSMTWKPNSTSLRLLRLRLDVRQVFIVDLNGLLSQSLCLFGKKFHIGLVFMARLREGSL